MVRTACLIGLIGALTAASRPEPKELSAPPAVELKPGYYRCKGESADGQPYACLAAVRKLGQTYVVEYYGSAPLVAAGVRQGDTLSIGFGGQRGCGVGVFRVLAGKLEGVTAQLPTPDGAHGRETLTYFAAFEEGEAGPGGEE